MEKTYKVTMYECHYPNYQFPGQMDRLYTSLDLIDFVNNTLEKKLTQSVTPVVSSTVAMVTSTKSLLNSLMMTSLETSNPMAP